MIMKILVKFLAVLLPAAILCAAAFGTYLLVKSKPEVSRARYESPPAVCDFIVANLERSRVWIEAQGSVLPDRRWSLQTEVRGRVAALHPSLEIGGRVTAGDELLRLDPGDFERALEQAQAELARAKFELDVEVGRAAVAEREWKLLDQRIETTEAGRKLALREPHLRFRRSALAGAEAQVRQRRADLDRAVIHAPFNGIVVEEDLEVGQVVLERSSLAQIVCTDAFMVRAAIPSARLSDLRFEQRDGEGSPAEVVQRLEDGTECTWTGVVERLVVRVGDAGRQPGVLIRVDDPMAMPDDGERRTPLLIGAYVRLRIQGPELADVVELERDHLREGDTVWLVGEENRLEILPVTVVARSGTTVFVRGIPDGAKVIVSALADDEVGIPLDARAFAGEQP